MRLALLGSLVVHTGVAAAAWLLSAPRAEAHGAITGAYLDLAPRVLPEKSVPPPPEPTAPASAAEHVVAPPAEETPEPVEITQAVPHVPRPFRLRAVTKLATPLPVRRAKPAPPPMTTRIPAPASTPAAPPRPGAPQGKLVAPRLLKAPAARYPSRARRLGWEGRVVLELRVSARGTVETVTIATSSGRAVLDRAAAEAAKRWSFRPATRDGKPIAHTVRVPFEFALDPP
ncbi:MAG: energy transducer TonB [Planctomycetota bacterium]|jgi:protein TonB